MLVENFLYFAEIVLWRNQDTALPQHWFRYESCDIARGGEADDFIERLGTLAAAFLGIVRPQ